MRIVGRAMRHYKTAQPLIGIFPYGVTVGREITENLAGETVLYEGGAPTREGAPLNPDHVRRQRCNGGVTDVTCT